MCRYQAGAALAVVLVLSISAGSTDGRRVMRKRSADSSGSANNLPLRESALAGLSSAGTRALQRQYVAAYNLVKEAKAEVMALVEPCKERVSEVREDIRARCLPCIGSRCRRRALDCQIEGTPTSAPSCDALRNAPDKAAIGRLCSHYMRTCPRADANATIACAKEACLAKVDTCDPCDQSSFNNALCETAQFGIDTKTFFDTTLPDFFEEDVADFFTEDVSDFFTEDVSDFFTEDVEDFFTDTIGENFLDFTTDIGNEFEGAFDSIGDFFTEDLSDFFTEGFGDLEDVFGDIEGAFDDLGDIFGDIGTDIGGGFEDLGSEITGGFESIGDFFGGRRRRRRRRSVGAASCDLIADSETRSGECLSAYRDGACSASCPHTTTSGGIDLATVCPEMTAKNATYIERKEESAWILGIPKSEVKMTFTSFVVDKSDHDVSSGLYGAVATARVHGTTFTFHTRAGISSATYNAQIPNVMSDAVSAYRAATAE